MSSGSNPSHEAFASRILDHLITLDASEPLSLAPEADNTFAAPAAKQPQSQPLSVSAPSEYKPLSLPPIYGEPVSEEVSY